jgi:GNAT superfamily N-acetyltransferase
MNNSLLENPIWKSLRTDHAHLAEGDDRARRYPHEIGPLAGIPDQSEASFNSLRVLAGHRPIGLFSLDPIRPSGNWTTIRSGRLIQMVRTATASSNPVPTPEHKPVSVPPDTSTNPTSPQPSTGPTSPGPVAPSSHAGGSNPSHCHAAVATLDPPQELSIALSIPLPAGYSFRQLTPSDAPAMVALAELTEPGPFRRRTIELGNFYGIFHGDRLVAMAGKRMHLPGFIEVSGVCTHPDVRGRGYAGALTQIIIDEIEEAGRTPFLHAWHDNPAQNLYESLGFTLSNTFNLAILLPA